MVKLGLLYCYIRWTHALKTLGNQIERSQIRCLIDGVVSQVGHCYNRHDGINSIPHYSDTLTDVSVSKLIIS